MATFLNHTVFPEGDKMTIIPLRDFTSYSYINKPDNILESLIFVFGFLVVFAFIRFRGKEIFGLWFSAVFFRKKTELLQAEGITQNLMYYVLALLLSFISISTSISFRDTLHPDLSIVLMLLPALCIWHFSALIMIRFLGWVFNAPKTSEEGIYNFWIFNIVFGLLLAPFIFALLFLNEFATALLLEVITYMCILFFLFKLLRWFQIFLHNKVSIFYMFLYLCVLEICPVLIMYKLLS